MYSKVLSSTKSLCLSNNKVIPKPAWLFRGFQKKQCNDINSCQKQRVCCGGNHADYGKNPFLELIPSNLFLSFSLRFQIFTELKTTYDGFHAAIFKYMQILDGRFLMDRFKSVRIQVDGKNIVDGFSIFDPKSIT